MTATPRLLAALALTVVAACDPWPLGPHPRDADVDAPIDGPIDSPIDTPISTDCPVANTPIAPALVVTDPLVLEQFAFARVMQQVLATARVNPAQSTRATFQQWMRTFGASPAPGDCDDPGIDPEGYGLVCPRAPEARLAQIDPFTPTSGVEFVPLGLFNRFDLAPADGRNCGEYRIVYGMNSRSTFVPGRALIIFEGVLANPNPAAGIDACLPVAEFWQGLTRNPSPSIVAARLESFYFTGGAVPGFAPLVSASAYGLADGATAAPGAGQVRTNFFIDSLEWQLREFKLRRACTSASDTSTCRLTFEHVPVQANPAEELFRAGHPRAPSFQSQFLTQVSRLASPSAAAVSMAPADVFDEYESVSSRTTVDYATGVFDPAFLSSIQSRLRAIGSPLSSVDILRRATTQTCAGCHQVSNRAALGGGLTWASSLEFVHIDENRRLSPALTGVFLPHRARVLENFINARCQTDAARRPADALDATAVEALIRGEQTIGGAAIGAAN